MVLFVHDFRAEADQCFFQAERLDRTNARWPYFRGVGRSIDQPESAIELLDRAAQLCGVSPPAPRLLLGELLLERGKVGAAEENFRAVLQNEPDNPRALLGMGRAADVSGKSEEARQYLTRAEEAAPGIKSVHILLATILQRSGDVRWAEQERRLADALPEKNAWPDPYMSEALSYRRGLESDIKNAEGLLNAGQPQAAAARLTQTVRHHPNAARAWMLLGTAQLRQGRFSEALTALETANKIDPGSVEAQDQLGVALFRSGQTARAETCFRRVIQLKPELGEARFNLALCLIDQNRPAEAIAALREATRLKPDLFEGYLVLAQLLIDQKQPEEALKVLKTAKSLNPTDSRIEPMMEKAHSR